MGKFVLFLALSVMMMAGRAHALTFALDGTLSGSTGMTFTPGGPYGSVSIADNGNAVDITVALADTTDAVTVLSLNLLASLGTSGWSVSGGNIGTHTLSVNPNATGWFSHFDIRIADSGTAYSNPLMFTLEKLNTDLDPSIFNTTSTEMSPLGIYAVVRTEDLGERTAYGASTPVPEPGTVTLLGIGFLGLAVYGKRRKTLRV